MAFSSTVRGALVGWERRSYEPFADARTGEQRPGGQTYWLSVSHPHQNGNDQEVTRLKVAGKDSKLWEFAVEQGWGCVIECEVVLFANGNSIVPTVTDLAVVEPEAA